MTMKLLADNTADTTDLSSVSFTSGIDSTYKLYIFEFININPATDGTFLTFQVNATDGADYNDSAITSSAFRAAHGDGGGMGEAEYLTGDDQAQGTAFQRIGYAGDGSDEHTSGALFLFNPSSTTYVKHWYSRSMGDNGEAAWHNFMAGYINDTTAIDDIQFKISSGNFDGTIKMYGVG